MDAERYDVELALRARDGDPEALAELVERTRLRLFAMAYGELRHYEDAQDAVASALLQICLHVHELREPEKARAWMRSIVQNEARRLRRRAGDDLPLLDDLGDPAAESGASLLRLDIERALRQLPSEEASALRLYYLADLSAREIARQSGRPEGTVRSWLHRGRRHLAVELEGYAPMKRREALKLLAATPALATTLEESPSMTSTSETPNTAPAPLPTVALIHEDLPPALVQQVTDALLAGGYETKMVGHLELPALLQALEGCRAVVVDEGKSGSSALPYLVHLRAFPGTRDLPVSVLCSDPPEFTISAYYITGVRRLIRKENPAEIVRLADPLGQTGLWRQFTEGALNAVHAAQEEAARLGEDLVGSEALLLGLIRNPENIGSRLLVERLKIPLERIRAEVDAQAVGGPGSTGRAPRSGREEVHLSPRGRHVIDLTDEESRRLGDGYIGTEHLLLGLLREGNGLAALVLFKLGVDLERARRELQAIRAD